MPRKKYLSADEIGGILKITRQGGYKVMYKFAAQGAEVIKVAGVRINEADFWRLVEKSRI